MKRLATSTAMLLVWAACFGTPAAATPPQAPVTVALTDDIQVITAGKQVVSLVLELKAVAPPVQAQLRVFVTPLRGQPVAAALVINRVVAVKGDQKLTVEIPFKAAGDFEVSAIVEKLGGSVSDAALGYVRLSEEGSATLMSPAEYLTTSGRERALSEPGFGFQPHPWRPGSPPPPSLQREAEEDKAARVTGVEGGGVNPAGYYIGSGEISTRPQPVRRELGDGALTDDKNLLLTGKVTTVVNLVTVPMANVSLQVWDNDPVTGDDLLGTTTTDANGNYSITVGNSDGPFGGGVDVYLYLTARQSGKVSIQQLVPAANGFDLFYYAWRSPTEDDIKVPQLGMDFSITTQMRAAAVWTGVSRAWSLSETASGHSLREVEVRYPGLSKGTYFRAPAIINIDPQLADSPATAGHEYGHAVMYQAYGGSLPGEGGPHFFCQLASDGLAWKEGFATYLGLVAGNSNGTFHWIIGDKGRSIENWSCNLTDMSDDEGRVAAALWDLWDSANDDNGGNTLRGVTGFSDANQGSQLVTLGQILKPLWKGPQNDVGAYWAATRPTLDSTQTKVSDNIMTYNYLKPSGGSPGR